MNLIIICISCIFKTRQCIFLSTKWVFYINTWVYIMFCCVRNNFRLSHSSTGPPPDRQCWRIMSRRLTLTPRGPNVWNFVEHGGSKGMMPLRPSRTFCRFLWTPWRTTFGRKHDQMRTQRPVGCCMPLQHFPSSWPWWPCSNVWDISSPSVKFCKVM